MKKLLIFLFTLLNLSVFAQSGSEKPRVKIENGILEGISSSGINVFKGIPFAAPPVGELRWNEPRPVKNWDGIKKADRFGPRAMQLSIYEDMIFRSNGMSEDCLYLNVWTPAKSANEKLPVLVYFYGGGLRSGDGSEARYDGESMARKGIVTLTVNYRLGIFGFFAHPGLSKETAYHGSGNYGFLDQLAALRWVNKNISAFGGDPEHVTIAGESAGSVSVSALMASPLSKNLIAGAIGESGALINPTLAPVSLAEGEQNGVRIAEILGAKSLAELRALAPEKLLEAASQKAAPRFHATVDGYFLPKFPVNIYKAGEQAHVPLLVGWNSEESDYLSILGTNDPTPENYVKALKTLYGDKAEEALKYYPASSAKEVIRSATALAGDRFTGYSTWKWYYCHIITGQSAVYRYYYELPRPQNRNKTSDSKMPQTRAGGAVHSAEIEYAMGNLPYNRVFDWQHEDYEVSAILQEYFANFIKTGNPNGLGLPYWPVAGNNYPVKVMHIDVNTRAEDENDRERYLWLDQFYCPAESK